MNSRKLKFQIEVSNRAALIAVAVASLVALLTLAIAITASNPGHTSNDIMISINNAEKTLQEAIDAREIGSSIFRDGVDGVVRTQAGWAKINIAGTSYVVPIYNINESVVRVYTSGKILEGHTIASDAYLCTYDDFRSYTTSNFCQAFGYRGSNGNVQCGDTSTQNVEYRHNGEWKSTISRYCSGQGLCSSARYIVWIECLK